MDDNENLIDFQKMNFTSFPTQFTNIPTTSTLQQFTNAKFTQNITTQNGQVVGLMGDGGLQFLRTIDSNAAFHNQNQANTTQANVTTPQGLPVFTIPITMPGEKPGDAQQTVQIQVLNPNPIPQTQKLQMGQMHIPIQGFHQGTTVLTVAYTPPDGELIPNHELPESMTVVAALQPQDLQLLAQSQSGNESIQLPVQLTNSNQSTSELKVDNSELVIKQEPKDETVWHNANPAECLAKLPNNFNINLEQFLKFNSVPMKRDVLNSSDPNDTSNNQIVIVNNDHDNQGTNYGDTDDPSTKKKRKYKKKPPKPKAPKPGQVHIATALDGTVLYCCPECSMAYPNKTHLEHHLGEHKIDRRYICDLCGAGLKRKEHLERHKLGHSPERPYTCNVCMKGFKRKEHLNLHFVIHSGEKNEICTECGKGFYRKDHLRKHAKSHATKRLKEKMNIINALLPMVNNTATDTSGSSTSGSIPNGTTSVNSADIQIMHTNATDNNNSLSTNNNENMDTKPPPTTITQAICLPTIHVSTSDNTTLPVQIQIPQLVTTSSPDGTTSTVVLGKQSTNDSMQ